MKTETRLCQTNKAAECMLRDHCGCLDFVQALDYSARMEDYEGRFDSAVAGLSDELLDRAADAGYIRAVTLAALIDAAVLYYMDAEYSGDPSDVEFLVSAVREVAESYAAEYDAADTYPGLEADE